MGASNNFRHCDTIRRTTVRACICRGAAAGIVREREKFLFQIFDISKLADDDGGAKYTAMLKRVKRQRGGKLK